ncbi:tetratricopeptide repeat protein [Gammaproteobacteria bacterium]|nr:tetratricopeptide repeat protein [Gammaproteobacteria bacterium]
MTLAAELFEKILKHHPNNLFAKKQLRRLQKRLQQSPSSKETIPGPPQHKISALVNLYHSGKMLETEQACRKLLNTFPQALVVVNVLGATLHSQGRLQEALQAFNRAVELNPDSAEARSNRGTVLQELGRLKEAESSYRKAIKLKPDYVEAYSNLGNTLQKFGRLKDAEASHRKAISLEPNHVDAHSNLGVILQELNRLKEAEQSHRKATVLGPKNAYARYNLGIVLHELGRLEEAEASYKKALTLQPNYAEAHYNLGNTLQGLNRLKDAEESYAKAILLRPNYAEAYSNLGNSLQGLGRLEEAEANYRKAIRLKPDYAEAYSNLGVTLQELERLEDSEQSHKKAVALSPDFAIAHYNLGLLLSEKKRHKEAAEHFKSSSFGDSKYQLLRCLYLLDEESLFFDELDYLINQGEVHPLVGSLGCRSVLRYGIKKPNLFCKDPLGYVSKNDLNTECDFEKIFVETARIILKENRVPAKRQGLLTNGIQTSGNLFDLEPDLTKEIQEIIHSEIQKYQNQYKESDEGLITCWPTEYSLYGWLVNMKSGGELRPHMHERGWISGSIYINVPPKSKVESGNFVVCIEEDHLKGENRSQGESIDVVTGSVCLFPASLLHYTIPFESKEERIVLAFDVVPT